MVVLSSIIYLANTSLIILYVQTSKRYWGHPYSQIREFPTSEPEQEDTISKMSSEAETISSEVQPIREPAVSLWGHRMYMLEPLSQCYSTEKRTLVIRMYNRCGR